jgi:hypothetical protein
MIHTNCILPQPYCVAHWKHLSGRLGAEYQEKIKLGIKEIERLTYLAEQLLVLAHFESQINDFNQQSILSPQLRMKSIPPPAYLITN